MITEDGNVYIYMHKCSHKSSFRRSLGRARACLEPAAEGPSKPEGGEEQGRGERAKRREGGVLEPIFIKSGVKTGVKSDTGSGVKR